MSSLCIAAAAEAPGVVDPNLVEQGIDEQSLAEQDLAEQDRSERDLSEQTLSEQELAEQELAQQQYAMAVAREFERQRRIYRRRTVAMLRRYMRYSLETGRIPALVGRELFRATVTKYRVTTFEDRVIFVHDMETCLRKLDEFSRQVLARVVLQEYEHWEAAQIFGCTRMTVHRKLLEALDRLSEILVEVELLDEIPSRLEKPCQEGDEAFFFVSDCEDGK